MGTRPRKGVRRHPIRHRRGDRPIFFFGSDSLACGSSCESDSATRITLLCAKSAWLAVADRRSGLVSPSCTKPVQRPPAIPVIPCPLVGRCAAPQLAPRGGGLGPDSGDVTRWQQLSAAAALPSLFDDRLASLANAINCYQSNTGRTLTNKMPDLKLIKFHVIT